MPETSGGPEGPPQPIFDYLPGTHSAVVETARRNSDLVFTGVLLALNGTSIGELTGSETIGAGAVAAGIGCLAVSHLKYRLDNGKLLAQQSARFNHAQNNWSQPIDWKKDTIRWYGFDAGYHEAGFDPLTNLGELQRLTAVAEKHHKSIAVSSTILDHAPDDAHYGYATTGRRFLSHKVIDLEADPQVIVMRPKAARKLIHDLAHKQTEMSLQRAMQLLEQVAPAHPAIKLYKQHKLQGAALLEKVFRPRIEERASDTSVYLERGDNGFDFQRRRSHTRGTLKGQHVHIYSETQLHDGTATIRHDGARHISDQQSFTERLDQARTKVAQGRNAVEDVETAIWLLLDHYKHQQVIPRGNARATSQAVQTRIQSERPRLYPYLRRYAAEKDEDTATLRFASPARNIALIGLSAILLGTGINKAGEWLVHHDSSSKAQDTFADSQSFEGAIGDVNSAKHPKTVWNISAVNGASTEGYWAEQVDNRLLYNTATLNLSTPPVADGYLSFERENVHTISKGHVSGYAVSNENVDSATPHLDVTGRTSADNYTDYGVGGDGSINQYGDFAQGFQLPVPNGDYVAHASVTIGGSELPASQIAVYENEDYTFSVRIRDRATLIDRGDDEVDLSYTIADPKRAILIPNAESSVTLAGQHDIRLADVLTRSDADTLQNKLRIKPTDTTMSAVAKAVADSHYYSYTPYSDAGAKSSVKTHSDHDVLLAVANQAISQPYANCNVATMETILMTRGLDRGFRPVNPVEGFHVDRGATTIKTTDAHMWITDFQGTVYDPTPSAFPPVIRKREADTPAAKDLVAAALALGTMSVAGFKLRQKASTHRRQQIAATLYPSDPETVKMRHKQASIIEWLRYSSPASSYNEATIVKRAEQNIDRPLSDRYNSIPKMGVKDFKRLLQGRGISIPEFERKELINLVKALHASSKK